MSLVQVRWELLGPALDRAFDGSRSIGIGRGGWLGLILAVGLLGGCVSAPESPAADVVAPSPTPTPQDMPCVPVAEVCDGQDNDCDGEIDEGLDGDSDGWTACEGDCDDADPLVHPDAAEVCDGLDTDCDGVSDPDGDGDGALDCADCAPSDPAISPAAPEVPGNLVDDDCDGWVDEVMFEPWSGANPLLRGAPPRWGTGISIVPYGPWGSLLTASTDPDCLIILDDPPASPPASFTDVCQVPLPTEPIEQAAAYEVIGVLPGQEIALVNKAGGRPGFGGTSRISTLGLAVLPGPDDLPAWHPLLDPEGGPLRGASWVDDPADASVLLVGRHDGVARVDLAGGGPATWLPWLNWEALGWSWSSPDLQVEEVLGGCDLDGNGVGEVVALLWTMGLGPRDAVFLVWWDGMMDQDSAPELWAWDTGAGFSYPNPYVPFENLTCLHGLTPGHDVLAYAKVDAAESSSLILFTPRRGPSPPLYGQQPEQRVVPHPPYVYPDPLPYLGADGGCSPGDLNGDGADDLVLWQHGPYGPQGYGVQGYVAVVDGAALWDSPNSIWDSVVAYWDTGPGDFLNQALCDRKLGRVYFQGTVWDAAAGSYDGQILFWP